MDGTPQPGGPAPHGPDFAPPTALPPGYGQGPPDGYGPGTDGRGHSSQTDPTRPSRLPHYAAGAVMLVALVAVTAWLIFFSPASDVVGPGTAGSEPPVFPATQGPAPTVSTLAPETQQPQATNSSEPPTPPVQTTRQSTNPEPPTDPKPTSVQPPDPEPTAGSPTPVESRPDSQPSRPPLMPTRVGQFEAMVQPEPETAFYTSSDGALLLVAAHYTGYSAEEGATAYDGVHRIGVWYCAPSAGTPDSLCLTDAHGGVVVIGNHPDAAALADWGDAFLALWR